MLVRTLFHSYQNILHKAPHSLKAYAAQSLVTGTLWAVGDIASQLIIPPPPEHSKSKYSSHRTLVTASYAASIVGPAAHFWYMWLDKTAMKLVGGGPKSLKFIACKVAADTCILGPLNILGFFMVLTLNSGEGERGVKKKRDFKDKVQKDFVSTYLTESAAWVPLQSLNFKFVPVQYHLLVVNLATIVDSAFVCWATANDEWFVKLFPSLVGATIADRAAAVEEERKKKGK